MVKHENDQATEQAEMPPEPQIAVSAAEAEAFAMRFGLGPPTPAAIEQMRAAMAGIARAGLAVPRVPSKFDAPADLFSVATINPTKQKEP
jgi:hypothetical protein